MTSPTQKKDKGIEELLIGQKIKRVLINRERAGRQHFRIYFDDDSTIMFTGDFSAIWNGPEEGQ